MVMVRRFNRLDSWLGLLPLLQKRYSNRKGAESESWMIQNRDQVS